MPKMSNDNTSMSFLDVMACALGGMAMLFLILAIMPHQGSDAKQQERTDQISMIPATPKPTQGNESKPKPVLYSIEHPNCLVENQSASSQADKLKPIAVLWSQTDGLNNARRRGYARILAGENAKIMFRDCIGPGDFMVEKIKDENAKSDIALLKRQGSQTILRYRSYVWGANSV